MSEACILACIHTYIHTYITSVKIAKDAMVFIPPPEIRGMIGACRPGKWEGSPPGYFGHTLLGIVRFQKLLTESLVPISFVRGGSTGDIWRAISKFWGQFCPEFFPLRTVDPSVARRLPGKIGPGPRKLPGNFSPPARKLPPISAASGRYWPLARNGFFRKLPGKILARKGNCGQYWPLTRKKFPGNCPEKMFCVQ